VTCWPPCSAWCVCVNDQCQPASVVTNAVRIRTLDGRYLQALNGGGGFLAPVVSNAPGTWETFLFEPPTVWPLTSGAQIALRHVTGTWAPESGPSPLFGPVLVRVDHGVRSLPRKSKKDPQLVTYQIGGASESVLVNAGFDAGYPAYPGRNKDSTEWIFTLTKIVGSTPAPGGTPIVSGDQVTFSFSSLNPVEPVRAWRVRDDVSPARIDGDAVPGGAVAPSVFVVEFNEVRPGLGWRPGAAPCQSCAGVTAHVTRRADGRGIAGAQVLALPPREPFSGTTPAAPAGGMPGGQVALSAFIDGADRFCIPAGEIRVQATADRYQTSTVTAQVPAQGQIVVPIPMDCTPVSGKVIDQVGSAVAGAFVFLRAQNGMPLRDESGNPYSVKTDLNGKFSFACVPHGFVKVTTAADPSASQSKTIGPEGWTDVVLIVQATAGSLKVVVVDQATGQPIPGAQVIVTTPDGVDHVGTTNANGEVTFPGLRPAGMGSIIVTATGYQPAFPPVDIPVTGSRTVTVPLVPDVAVQFPTAFVIQLDWGLTPRDLDLHCSGPDQAGGRFHCYFDAALLTVAYVALDADDITGTGPERITISQVAGAFVPGDYHVWVHQFANAPPPGLDVSGASVTLLSLDGMSLPTQLGRWDVVNTPGPPNRIWSVIQFTINAQGTVTATNLVNAYQAGTDTTVL
jgi:Carboxypeptidase regulatory-like domain